MGKLKSHLTGEGAVAEALRMVVLGAGVAVTTLAATAITGFM